jgi:Fe-S oxidoreductase
LVNHDAGDRAGAVAMAKQTIEALEREAVHWIVTGGTSCAIAVLHDYEHLLAGEPAWQERAKRLAGRTLDLTTFLDQVAQLGAGALVPPRPPNDPEPPSSEAVTYHSFCGSTNTLKLIDPPRRIIRDVLGYELREMEEAGVCCGFGGSFSVDHPNVSRLVAERKMANVDATGALTVVTDNPGCIAHLRGAMHASGRPQRVIHMAELIAERLRQLGAV